MALLDPKNVLLLISIKDGVPYFLLTKSNMLPEISKDKPVDELLIKYKLQGKIIKRIAETKYNATISTGIRLHYTMYVYLGTAFYKDVENCTWNRLDQIVKVFAKQVELIQVVIKGYLLFINLNL